jgi:hypothetical protein
VGLETNTATTAATVGLIRQQYWEQCVVSICPGCTQRAEARHLQPTHTKSCVTVDSTQHKTCVYAPPHNNRHQFLGVVLTFWCTSAPWPTSSLTTSAKPFSHAENRGVTPRLCPRHHNHDQWHLSV